MASTPEEFSPVGDVPNYQPTYGGDLPPPPVQSQPAQAPYEELFASTEAEYQLPKGILKSLASQESNYNPNAEGVPITSKGSTHVGDQAMGLFQFMPKTWEAEGHVGDPRNPVDATKAAAKKLSKSFKNRGTLGGALKDWYGRGIAPPGHPTTEEFMSGVIGKMNAFGREDRAIQQPQAQSSIYNTGGPNDLRPLPPLSGERRVRPMPTAVAGPPPPDNRGDFLRGGEHSLKVGALTLSGLVAAAGATGESIYGEGEIATGIKKWGLENFKRWQENMKSTSKKSDSLSYSLGQASKGDLGSLVDWFQYALGYGGAEVLQALATFGIGGVAAKTIAKGTVKDIVTPMVAKEMYKISASEAGKGLATSAVQKIAVGNVAKKLGGYGLVGARGFGMEGGEIGGGLAEKSDERGTSLTGGEIAQGLAATAAAGSLDFFGNFIGLKAIRGKLGAPAGSLATKTGMTGRLRRGAAAAPLPAAVEGATEFGQTYIEEWGQRNPITNDTFWQAFDAAGLGAVAGGGAGAGGRGGFLSTPQPELVGQTVEESQQLRPDAPPPKYQKVETNPEARTAAEEEDWINAQQQQLDTQEELPMDVGIKRPMGPPEPAPTVPIEQVETTPKYTQVETDEDAKIASEEAIWADEQSSVNDPLSTLGDQTASLVRPAEETARLLREENEAKIRKMFRGKKNRPEALAEYSKALAGNREATEDFMSRMESVTNVSYEGIRNELVASLKGKMPTKAQNKVQKAAKRVEAKKLVVVETNKPVVKAKKIGRLQQKLAAKKLAAKKLAAKKVVAKEPVVKEPVVKAKKVVAKEPVVKAKKVGRLQQKVIDDKARAATQKDANATIVRLSGEYDRVVKKAEKKYQLLVDAANKAENLADDRTPAGKKKTGLALTKAKAAAPKRDALLKSLAAAEVAKDTIIYEAYQKYTLASDRASTRFDSALPEAKHYDAKRDAKELAEETDRIKAENEVAPHARRIMAAYEQVAAETKVKSAKAAVSNARKELYNLKQNDEYTSEQEEAALEKVDAAERKQEVAENKAAANVSDKWMVTSKEIKDFRSEVHPSTAEHREAMDNETRTVGKRTAAWLSRNRNKEVAQEVKDTPVYKRTVEQIKEWIVGLQAKGLKGITVVDTFDNLPKRVKDTLDKNARGAYDSKADKIYLIADKIKSKKLAIFVAVHEATHRGLLKVFGEDLVPLLRVIYSENSTVRGQTNERMAAFPALTQEEAIEEVLADMAASNPEKVTKLKGWKRLVDAIIQWLSDALAIPVETQPQEGKDGEPAKPKAKPDYTKMNIPTLQRFRTRDSSTSYTDSPAADDTIVLALVRGAASEGLESGKGKIAEGTGKVSASVASPNVTLAAARDALLNIDKKGHIREVGTSAVDFGLKWLSTLGQFTKVVSKVLPSAKTFNDFVRLMSNEANEDEQAMSKIVVNWNDLTEEESSALTSFITDTDEVGMRPDKEFKDSSNRWGVSQQESEEAALKEYKKLKATYDKLPSDKARKIFSEQADMSTHMIKKLINNLVTNIRDTMPESEAREDMIKNLKARWKSALDGRPWIPHKRYGKWVVIVKPASGEREVYGYDTQVQAEEAKKSVPEGTEVSVIRGDQVFNNLNSTDRGFISALSKEVVAGVTDDAERKKLQEAVQNLYIASLPEAAGAKRLMTRKNVAGWSTNYRRAWKEGMMSMARYSSKLQYMNRIQDSVEDAGREAGRINTVFAVTHWRTKSKAGKDRVLATEFFSTALAKSEFVGELGADQSHDVHTGTPESLLASVNSTYVAKLETKEAGDKAFESVESKFRKEDMLNTLRVKPYSDSAKGTRYYGLLQHRYDAMLSSSAEDSQLTSILLNLGFVSYLGWTPAFAFMNVTQVSMLTLPRLSALYGAGKAASAIGRGYKFTAVNKKVFSNLATGAWGKGGLDVLRIEDFKNEDGTPLAEDSERAELLRHLLKFGKLDFTQGSELHSSENQPEAIRRIVKSSSWLAHPTEVLNRVVTALATYELAYEKLSPTLGKKKRADMARDKAMEVLDRTQYDYAPENRPLILSKPVFRVALQFRQFSQQTAWQMGEAVVDALNKLPTEQRREQRAYLVHMLATTMVFAGARGLPFMGSIMLLLSIIGDSEDDPDFELQKYLRDNFGDALGAVAAGGVFNAVGIDATRNIGYGDLLPSDASRPGTKSEQKLKDNFWAMMGPLGSITGNIARGIDYYEKGDTYRAVESSLPKVARTALKSYRLGTEGVTTSSGVVRLAPNQLSFYELGLVAAGLQPSKLGWLQDNVNSVQTRVLGLQSQKKMLQNRLRFATETNDKAEVSELMRKVGEWNKEHPRYMIKGIGKGLFRQQGIADMTGGIATNKAQMLELADQLDVEPSRLEDILGY